MAQSSKSRKGSAQGKRTGSKKKVASRARKSQTSRQRGGAQPARAQDVQAAGQEKPAE